MKSRARSSTAPTDATHGRFRLDRAGSEGSIRQFITALPKRTELYWVSFTLIPSKSVLEAIRTCGHSLKIVCRDPASRQGMDGRGDDEIDRILRNWPLVSEYMANGTIPTLRGVTSAAPHTGFDEEDPPEQRYGFLHAKFIVGKSKGRGRALSRYFLALGSFNLAVGSLAHNCESFFEVDRADQDSARSAWNYAEELNLSKAARPLQESDFARWEPEIGQVVPEGAPAQTGSREDQLTPADLAEEEPYRPEDLRLLAETLDADLKGWHGCDWQWKQYRGLRRRAARLAPDGIDILYLPVGTGKTWIALRWLLWRVHEANASRARRGRPPVVGVFLTPNQWVRSTVQRDLNELAERAVKSKVGRRLRVDVAAGRYVRVIVPSEASQCDEVSDVVAVVADECHNWDPDNLGGENTYTPALNRWRGRVPVLGLSATPCRMKDGRYSVSWFAGKFLDTGKDASLKPGIMLEDAIRRGFLTKYKVRTLLADRQEDVRDYLSREDGVPIEMGDYAGAALGAVWDILTEDLEALVMEIMDHLRSRCRAVVFLPPVGDRTNAFIRSLEKEVLKRSGNGHFFDFLSSASSQQQATELFDEFRRVPVAKGRPAVLVTVNRFNEGVSIQDIDALVMLRASLSPRVAVQALGRGLRLHDSKKDCLILDGVLFSERLTQWENGSEAEDVPVRRERLTVPQKVLARAREGEFSRGTNFAHATRVVASWLGWSSPERGAIPRAALRSALQKHDMYSTNYRAAMDGDTYLFRRAGQNWVLTPEGLAATEGWAGRPDVPTIGLTPGEDGDALDDFFSRLKSGLRLRLFREGLGLTHAEIASAVGQEESWVRAQEHAGTLTNEVLQRLRQGLATSRFRAALASAAHELEPQLTTGRALRRWRKGLRYSPKQFAPCLKISVTTLDGLERESSLDNVVALWLERLRRKISGEVRGWKDRRP